MANKYRLWKELNHRTNRYLTMEDIANIMGCSRITLYNKLSGKTKFRADELEKLSMRFNVTADQILEWVHDGEIKAGYYSLRPEYDNATPIDFRSLAERDADED